MIKINFIVLSSADRGSTRIRVFNLVNALKRYDVDVRINAPLYWGDICAFHKELKPNKLERRLRLANLLGKFTCFDIDDYFEDYKKVVKAADLCINSTAYLQKINSQYNLHDIVVDNSLDVDDVNIKLKQDCSAHQKVCWYGCHVNAYILDKFNIKNVTIISEKGDIIWHKETIDQDLQKFDLTIIPQEKTPHTLAKTHCRMLKALYLGVPVMVTDMPEYVDLAQYLNYPKEFIVTNSQDWNQKIEDFKSGKLKFSFDFEQARKKILQRYAPAVIADSWIKQVKAEYLQYQKHKIRNWFKKNSLKNLYRLLKITIRIRHGKHAR